MTQPNWPNLFEPYKTKGGSKAIDNAKLWTRLGTWRDNYELIKALDKTWQVDDTFCILVNNVLIVYSATAEEHAAHVEILQEMLRKNDMTINPEDSVFDVKTSIEAGISIHRLGFPDQFIVTNEGVPGR